MSTKQKITYCIWINHQAEEVADYYIDIFKNIKITETVRNPIDTPSGKAGTVLTVSFELEGQQFMLMNGGPKDKLNPSISFFINCTTPEEVEDLWDKLSKDGKALMPLDKYPFSDKFGWVEDKYGVSWQLMLPREKVSQKVLPSLLFVNEAYGKAEEAINHYTSIFNDSKIGTLTRYPGDMAPDKKGTILFADFMLEREWFSAMDSAHRHSFQFDETISFMVHCDTQDEIDYYWDKLTEGGKEVQCGWLVDKFGISWQIVPDALLKLYQSNDKQRAGRAMKAMMQMVKLDIVKLKKA